MCQSSMEFNKLNSVQRAETLLNMSAGPAFQWRYVKSGPKHFRLCHARPRPTPSLGLGCTSIAMLVSFSDCGRPVLRPDEFGLCPSATANTHYVLLLEHAINSIRRRR